MIVTTAHFKAGQTDPVYGARTSHIPFSMPSRSFVLPAGDSSFTLHGGVLR